MFGGRIPNLRAACRGGGGSRACYVPSRQRLGSLLAKHDTPDPNPQLFWCWDAPRLSQAVKERRLHGANAILSLCQQQCGPQHSARDVCIGPEKFLISRGRQHTPPVSPQGPCLFWSRYSKVQKCLVQLLYFSGSEFRSSSHCLRPHGEGMGRRRWLQGREHKELPPIHTVCQCRKKSHK